MKTDIVRIAKPTGQDTQGRQLFEDIISRRCRVRFFTADGRWIDVERAEDGGLEILASDSLLIAPRTGNVVVVSLREPT